MWPWLIPPQHPDPGQNARVRLVHFATMVGGPLFFASAAGTLLLEYEPVRAANSAMAGLLMAVAFLLNRRDRNETAGIVLVAVPVGATFLAQLLTSEGARANAVVLLPMMLVLSGVLFGRQKARLASAAIFLCGVIPAMFEAGGLVHPALSPPVTWGRPVHMGLVLGLSAVIVDQIVDTLRQAEERYRRLVSASFEGIARIVDGRMTQCNEQWERMLGYTLSELDSRPDGYRSLVHPDDLPRLLAHKAEHDEHPVEVRFRHREGRFLHLELRGRFEDGRTPSAVVLVARDITQARDQERARREAESRFRALFDESVELAGLLLPDGRIVEANPTALQLAGISADEVRGRPFWDCPWWTHDVHQRDRVREAVSRAAAGELARFETTHVDAAGRLHYVDFSIKPLRADDGSVRLLLPEGRDITERKAAEMALRESEERFRMLVERAPVGVVLGRERKAVYANPAARRIFGWEGPEFASVLAVPVIDLVAPRDRPAALARLAERELGRDPGSDYYPTLLRHDGTEFPAHLVARSVVLSDGLAITWFVTDLTDRRQAEATAARLAAIVEQSADDIILAGRDECIEYVNPAFVQRNGIGPDEVAGRRLRTLFEGAEPGTIGADIQRELAKGASWQGRLRHRRTDGTSHVHDESATPIRGGSGEICGYVLVRRDITHQIQTEESAANAERLHAIGTLAGGIAHDFNNVLGAIIGYSEIARQNVEEGSAPWQEIGFALRAAHRASDLVSQILAFARQPTKPAAPMRPGPVVKEALKFLRAALPADVDVREGISLGSLVISNPSEIQRVVMNLCTNAALAMQHGGGTLEVRLEDIPLDEGRDRAVSLPPGRYVRLTVRDTGCGIPAEVQARIFEPFFTTRAEGSGTGMGLAVVHGIVASRGGAVTVESRVGEGSTFAVYLPAAEGALDTAPRTSTMPARGEEHILFVDDEPMLTDVASRALRGLGYQVQAFTSCPQALAALRDRPNQFDLVISDMNMPRMNGAALIRHAREIRPDLPIILCTGALEHAESDLPKDASADALVAKPVSMVELSVIMRRVLEARHKQRGDKE